MSIIASLAMSLAMTGCVSQKTANLQAQAAYMSGQQQSARQWQSQRPPQVVIRGAVRNPVVDWVDGLTLSKAIVAAEYTGFMNPVVVRIVRNGQMVDEMKGVDLLHGRDEPLEPGDVILLQ